MQLLFRVVKTCRKTYFKLFLLEEIHKSAKKKRNNLGKFNICDFIARVLISAIFLRNRI